MHFLRSWHWFHENLCYLHHLFLLNIAGYEMYENLPDDTNFTNCLWIHRCLKIQKIARLQETSRKQMDIPTWKYSTVTVGRESRNIYSTRSLPELISRSTKKGLDARNWRNHGVIYQYIPKQDWNFWILHFWTWLVWRRTFYSSLLVWLQPKLVQCMMISKISLFTGSTLSDCFTVRISS